LQRAEQYDKLYSKIFTQNQSGEVGGKIYRIKKSFHSPLKVSVSVW